MKITNFKLPKGFAILAMLTALVASAFADTLTLNTNAYSNGNGLGGGEFSAVGSGLDLSSYNSKAIVGGGFETYCMEYMAHVSSGGVYSYSTFTNIVYSGDVASGGDPLSKGTSYLYSQFASGALAGFNYNGTTAQRQASSNALQLAFWFLEDETAFISGYTNYDTPYNPLTNMFITAVVGTYGSVANAKANAALGENGVYALNLTSPGNNDNQSQLYYHVPDNGTTLALLGLGFLGLAALRLRFTISN